MPAIHPSDRVVICQGYHRAALAAQNLGKLDDAIALLDKGIDNCVSNDELKQLRDSIKEQKKKPRGASKVGTTWVQGKARVGCSPCGRRSAVLSFSSSWCHISDRCIHWVEVKGGEITAQAYVSRRS